MQEEALSGGNMTEVARVGDTVRRTSGAWTATVHRLLAHVRKRDLLWVPELLGFDERGREVLSFIPGDVPHDMPAWAWSGVALGDVARALRSWHDATVGLDLFLDAYAAAGSLVRYERSAVIEATIERLHAIAKWTADHVQATGALALEHHPAMYQAHAQWLKTWPTAP